MIDVDKYLLIECYIVDCLKVVFVGWFCDFKIYNFIMLSVIKYFCIEGYELIYYIYGDGLDSE